MKFNYILLILFSMQFIACSTSPYLKETELPKNIQYYSEEKQFKVKPEWYWRLRPVKESVNDLVRDKHEYLACIPIVNYGYAIAKKNPEKAVIGSKYILERPGHHSKVIGEILENNERFYIAHWENYGYFFIKKDDYDFAQEFEKYKEANNFRNKYKSQNMGIIATCYYSWARLAPNEDMMQYHDFLNNRYSNSFMQYKENTLSKKFHSTKPNETSDEYYVFVFNKQIQYTNDIGQVFIGDLYTPTYIISTWGEWHYSFPCDWYKLTHNK